MSESRNIKGAIKHVKVDTSGLKRASADYKDYQRVYAVLHLIAYSKKYGYPKKEEEWRIYASCLKRDLRKAMIEDDVPRDWYKNDLCIGTTVDLLRNRFIFKNFVYSTDNCDDPLKVVYDEDKKVYKPIDKVPEVFHAIQGLNSCSLSKNKCEDIIHTVSGLSETVNIRNNPDEIPCENYLYNEKTKEKVPYSEEVFITYRGAVDYNPDAKNPHIHNPDDNAYWDFDSWLLDLLGGDPEMVRFFWQIVARLIRPFRAANGIVLFAATTGNNGKGTLIKLFRELLGAQAWVSIPLAEFSDRFGLADILTAQAILTDENRMEYNFDGADRLKAAADGSYFKVEQKHKGYILTKFNGLMIQCVNELPRIKDKSGSWYRRLAIVPFSISFTGRERKYIKNDYLERAEVLEYVKKRAIETKIEDKDLHDLMPSKCLAALEEYKVINDPIRQFWGEMSSRLVWDKIPGQFLYDLYVSWNTRNNRSGKAISRIVFYKQMEEILKDDPAWISKNGQNDKIRVKADDIFESEELILEYDLTNWMDQSYRGTDVYRKLNVKLPNAFRGYIRVLADTDK